MLERHRARVTLVAIATVLTTSACSLLVEGEVGGLELDQNAKRDVVVSLRDFGPHVDQLLDVRIVDPGPTPSQVLAHGVVEAVPSDCVDLRFRRGAPPAASQVDFYADLNGNGMRDAPPADHTWREELDADGALLFVHDVQFADLSTNAPAELLSSLQLRITDVEGMGGSTVTVLVRSEDLVNPELGERRPTIPGVLVTQVDVDDLSVESELSGVIDPGSQYEIILRFGALGVTECVISIRAPADGTPLAIDEAFSDLSCSPREPPDCRGLDTACDGGDAEACAELATECAFVDCAR